MENNPVFVLLAGGKSERMGMPKGLLPFKETFWILEQLRRISLTSLKTVYIGLGFQHQDYFEAIDWFEAAMGKPFFFLGMKVAVVINETPDAGPFSTLQKVISHISGCPDILVHPIDTPLLNREELQRITDQEGLIVLPNYEGKNGHPVKLKYAFWEKLKFLDPADEQSRLDVQIKQRDAKEIVPLAVSGEVILLNFNTPAEWESGAQMVQKK